MIHCEKNMGTAYYRLVLIFCSISAVSFARQTEWIPCVELKRELHVPCRCSVSTVDGHSIEMSCDRAVFTRDIVNSLVGHPIVSISQRNSGYKRLPEELLNVGLNLRKLDLSENSISRLMERLLRAQTQLEELKLADNLLGDSLNPIFSSNEFHSMKRLKLLDLSRNGLRSIEEGILKGCESLEQLYLDGNKLSTVPTLSLKGPKSLRVLSLSGNSIGSLPRVAFSTVGESLLRLDMSENELSHMEDDALAGLERLLLLNISCNDLSRFNSDVFKGAYSLLQLDLSTNFLREFPSDALRHLMDLKFLNISNNLIGDIEQTHLSALRELQVLDLSRNSIGRLGVNTFSNLSELIRLDLSLNALRTIEESSFNGLANLKWLSLQDNNILLVPVTALRKLPALATLRMEFNRVAVLPTELIEATASSLVTLALTRNLVREIPVSLFQDFERLRDIELSGNMLTRIDRDTFTGLEETVRHLDVSSNKLSSIENLPLTTLVSLNLGDNRLTQISTDTFASLKNLRHLNLSSNPLYGGFPPVLPSSVIDLDISRTGLQILPTVLLLNLESLETVSIAGNRLQTIGPGTFNRLGNLSRIDLSRNRIERIENGAFVGLAELYELNLQGNKLNSFEGEHFDTGTGLEILDLSNNRISRLSPTAFAIHPRLRLLDLSDNRLLQFRSEYLKPLQFLEWFDLSGNGLQRVAEFAFSQLGHLRELNLASNRIESLDELAFHNSTQLQLLDLSGNRIEALSERTMEGLLRLEHLSLRNNRLASLPEMIFDETRLRTLESIDLSGNRLNEIPIRCLQKQTGSLVSLNIARNRVVQLLSEQVPSNVKELDLSNNPLSVNAINAILGEAKILRSLNLANTRIERLAVRLETPFLKLLNLSGNGLTKLEPAVLERTTMLEMIDLSRNKLSELSVANAAFKALPTLSWLDVSSNQLLTLNEASFDGLSSLRTLNISSLPNCTRIERNAFKPFGRLRYLSAYGYPKLGYFDVQGILKGLTSLETLDIEIKDPSVSNEQLSMRAHPRLREVILRGERLRTVLSSSLVGVRASKLMIGLKNTSIDSIPATLFFPVPRSTVLELDITGSKFTTLSPQFLAALDERTGSVRVKGLRYNPISCNCDSTQLWKWLKLSGNDRHTSNHVICSAPDHLAGTLLTNLTEDRLLCEFTAYGGALGRNHRRPTVVDGFDAEGAADVRDKVVTIAATGNTIDMAPSSAVRPSYTEPEIIWTVAPTVKNVDRNKHYKGDHTIVSSSSGNAAGTDDTLIIGIVAGVVAFIALIMIVICVCRLRWYSGRIDQTRLAAAFATSSIPDASMIRPGSVYSGKLKHDLYLGSYNGSTLERENAAIPSSVPAAPVQIMPFVQQPMHFMHTLLNHAQPLSQLQSQSQSQFQSQSQSQTQSQSQSQSQLQSQQFYGYCDTSSLPIYFTCSTDAKEDKNSNDNMIEPLLEEGAWGYWVVSVGALLSFLGLIVACICSCRRNDNKNEFLGLAGMVTLNDSDNDGINRIQTSDALRVATQDAIDSVKRSTGANRSLPDIPKDKEKRDGIISASASQDIYETTEIIGDHSELYATVRDTAAKGQVSELGVVEVSHQDLSGQNSAVDQYSRRYPLSPNSDNVEHPYAQLQNIQKIADTNQSTRVSVKQATDTEKPSTSVCQINENPVAPPRTRRSSSQNSLLSTDTGSCDIQAANAISGGVQANQELPYMTPPLLMLLPQPPQHQSNSPQQHFSGDSQDSKGYTSISVREPLANIIAQTKTICRQNQSTRMLTDPHYATVSDDSDEMYAAIDDQDKVYTSGSETYAQIQPSMAVLQRVQNEQALSSRAPSHIEETYSAPQPPSVDSLRHVAHAHSRQASSSSANSSIVNPGSPKPEKRQANSPLPPPPEGTVDVYASIEKRTRNEDRSKSILSGGKSLEDMYAKVMKKKRDVEEQRGEAHFSPHGCSPHSDMVSAGCGRKPSLIDVNRISWSSHDSMEIQKKEFESVVGGCGGVGTPAAGNCNSDGDILVKSSLSSSSPKFGDDADAANFEFSNCYQAESNDLPGKVCDPSYEVLRPQQRAVDRTIPEPNQPLSSSVSIGVRNNMNVPVASSYAIPPPFKHRQISNASSEDPGYEKVRLRKHGEMDHDTDSEPNYESMPHDSGEPNYASVCRPGDSDTDPNYESVNHGDPNYESVKYMSVPRAEEPPYEQVNTYKSVQDPDGYEKVKKQALFNADYERILHQDYCTKPVAGDTDDEQYVQV